MPVQEPVNTNPVSGAEEDGQFKGGLISQQKIFYGEKLNPMEDS